MMETSDRKVGKVFLVFADTMQFLSMSAGLVVDERYRLVGL